MTNKVHDKLYHIISYRTILYHIVLYYIISYYIIIFVGTLHKLGKLFPNACMHESFSHIISAMPAILCFFYIYYSYYTIANLSY